MIRTRTPRLAAGAIGCVVMLGNRPTTHTHHIELHRRPAACLLASAASGAAQRVEHRDDQCGEGEEAGHSGLLGERVSITIGLMTHPATIFPGGDPDAVAQCSAMLRGGGLVGMPTETVYGLACDALNPRAVAGVFAAKERPSFDPLIVHIRDLDHAQTLAVFDATAIKLAQRFWPGPLTLVLPKQTDQATGEPAVPGLVTAGLGRVGLRVPAHPVAQAILRDSGLALAAPSANRFGSISPTTAQHVADELAGRVDFILDDGPCSVGVESTIVKVEGENVTLLREGGMPVEMLEEHLGTPVLRPTRTVAIESPGQLLTHYAPSLPLRLNADSANNGEALLAFGPTSLKDAALNLSEIGDLSEAARNLFAMLKQLDASGATGIAVQSIPKHGLGAAINDRLTRAAHREEKLENAE